MFLNYILGNFFQLYNIFIELKNKVPANIWFFNDEEFN